MIARGEIGQKEIKGGNHNPRILEYHSTTTLKATDDETYWCSSFVNWCITQAGFKGTNSAASLSWKEWGLPINEPRYGTVVVLKRTGGGHVGFAVGQNIRKIFLLGGNQGNEVKISAYPKEKVVAYKIPNGYKPADFEPLPELDSTDETEDSIT